MQMVNSFHAVKCCTNLELVRLGLFPERQTLGFSILLLLALELVIPPNGY
jgi:hypothetical protein